MMLGLGCEAHLKTTHKQEAHLEVLILEEGRWHGLVVSHCKKKKKTHQDPLMKAAPACFEQRVCHGWCLLCGSRSNCDTQLLEFALFKFFMFKSSEGKKQRGGKTGSLININILMCERGREDLSGLAAFNPCWGAFLSFCLSCSLFLQMSSFTVLLTDVFIF